MSPPVSRVVVVGRDTALWLAAATIQRALKPSGVTVEAVELPSALGPSDVHATLPALEALHNQLRIDEAALLRATRGAFSLGQNFVDTTGGTPAFLHPYGAFGAAIDGKDFFAYWLKARRFGLGVSLEDFSLTAAAARHGRLLIPDDESEIYGRSDYGYHLPTLAYAAVLKAAAIHHGVVAHLAQQMDVALGESGDITALHLDGDRRIEGELFIDATGADALLIGAALSVGREDWRAHFPADRILTASGPGFASIPVYAELRAWDGGWAGIYPSQARSHVVQAYASVCSDEGALREATAATGIDLADAVVRSSDPGRRERAWERNCVAIGAATCAFDPVHSVDLYAVQLGLVHLLACFPASGSFAAQRAEYNRITRAAFDRVRDFQSAHYALNRYAGLFWTQARKAAVSLELTHGIATFRSRGEIAPWEEESFAPDSWRALFTGHGLVPDSHLPTIDRTPPDEMKAQFRRMLGFVKEQVLKQPTHDAYLARISDGAHV